MSRKGGPHIRPEDPDATFNDDVKAKLKEYDTAVDDEQAAIARVTVIALELRGLGVSELQLLETGR